MNGIKKMKGEPAFAFVVNFLMMMLAFSLCRVFFYLANASLFTDMTFGHFMELMKGGLQFDLTALLYTNALYLVMQILPFPFRYNELYQKIAKWIFVVTNSLAIIGTNIDVVYFRFTGRRTTSSVFSEFENEGNLGKVFEDAIISNWYVFLFVILLIFAVYKFYYFPTKQEKAKAGWTYYLCHTGLFCLFVYFTIIGIRGGFGAYVRPITMSNANQYVNKSNESAIVLNTPFCVYRTLSRSPYKDPKYFRSRNEMEQYFSPMHYPKPTGQFKPMNVVIIIMESFGKEYIGYFNHDLDNGTYKGYTPFLDSLLAESLSFDYSFSNGRKSIDAMPSILSSIPMFKEPYVLTPYYVNEINSIASLLGEKGYYSAFFHGAPNGSMGFQAFAKSAKFKDYFGMDEYDGPDAFDGTWAIWDEEFFQFFAKKMGGFKQPFVTSIFSASSHHPFSIPQKYEGKFPKGDKPIHQCIGYSDYALKRFFEAMSKYEWFNNTLFVLSADHTNQVTHKEYTTDAEAYSIPIFFYNPGSNLKGKKKELVQQIDIMPSILGYLNYDKPYVAFGNDVLTQYDPNKYNVNYSNQMYQIYRGDMLFQFDGEKPKALYNYRNDRMLQHNLIGKMPVQDTMEVLLKANIQQYLTRMINNELIIK
ncbi:MAG TPA: sulfatase-like hydrolase/transferase [Paludibacteraceae bacterium]|jgi:phosphoglycerol transferase MdoB-like AlkP superfamily enzyme|nr:sulfatase-like hydrolase/transferase [Paludibacteraceae bacterium]HOU66958.1 sulfatase-like hydrolase/transferase [Paludibacteraceae bacterium]HQF49185.1 sulfatase-like hydrolase/transferase [Paludibacteraceae bacterium]